MNQKPYNKSLINLVCSVCKGKYLLIYETSGKYSPVHISHSVNKTLVSLSEFLVLYFMLHCIALDNHPCTAL